MAEKEIAVRVRVEGVSNEATELEKISLNLKNLNQQLKDYETAARKGIASKELLLQMAATRKEINEQKLRQSELNKIINSAEGSVFRLRAEHIKLQKEYYTADAATREKMIPGINKLHGEITKAEQAIGVFSRNVGNYPKIMSEAGTVVGEFANATEGAAGQIAGVTSSILTATGPVGAFTALIAALAAAWKETKENIELYLKSADKLAAGPAGFERDAKTARIDTRKRAEGQYNEGLRINVEAQNYLLKHAGSLNEEQKAYYESLVKSGEQMMLNGRKIITETYGVKNKHEWQRKYNALLMEEEKLSDQKLENATKWEALEAEMLKQRAIVSADESSSEQKKQASIRADEISLQLASEKTQFINKQIDNLSALAEMTASQEVYEDQINGLLKDRNTVQKEYYGDQIKINKLERNAAKDTKAELDEQKKDLADILKLRNDIVDSTNEVQRVAEKVRQKAFDDFSEMVKKEAKPDQFREGLKKILGISESDLGLQKMNPETVKGVQDVQGDDKAQRERAQKIHEDKILAIKQAGIQGAQAGADAAFANKKARLQAEMEAELSNANLTEQQKAAIKKKYAKEQQRISITQAIINGALAVGNALATTQPFMPMAIIAAALAAAQTGIQIATIKAAKYNTGGKITAGIPIQTGTPDNLLIAVNNREAVINERQIARLGGSGAMKAAGVPGFATGGYIGSSIPSIPSAMPNSEADKIIDAINTMRTRIEVVNDLNKVRSGLSELEAIQKPQKI